ncbi:SDR family oxidoreductase [Geodermatophilus sp. URMC 63]
MIATSKTVKYRADEEAQTRRTSRWPIPRMTTPDEIAAGAVYLSSPGAGYTTGSLLV